MQPTLRLIDPSLLLSGLALMVIAACVVLVARRLRDLPLYAAAACLLVLAVPRLLRGCVDIAVWFGWADHDTYPPSEVAILMSLQPYILIVVAACICLSTMQFLRRSA